MKDQKRARIMVRGLERDTSQGFEVFESFEEMDKFFHRVPEDVLTIRSKPTDRNERRKTKGFR